MCWCGSRSKISMVSEKASCRIAGYNVGLKRDTSKAKFWKSILENSTPVRWVYGKRQSFFNVFCTLPFFFKSRVCILYFKHVFIKIKFITYQWYHTMKKMTKIPCACVSDLEVANFQFKSYTWFLQMQQKPWSLRLFYSKYTTSQSNLSTWFNAF